MDESRCLTVTPSADTSRDSPPSFPSRLSVRRSSSKLERVRTLFVPQRLEGKRSTPAYSAASSESIPVLSAMLSVKPRVRTPPRGTRCEMIATRREKDEAAALKSGKGTQPIVQIELAGIAHKKGTYPTTKGGEEQLVQRPPSSFWLKGFISIVLGLI